MVTANSTKQMNAILIVEIFFLYFQWCDSNWTIESINKFWKNHSAFIDSRSAEISICRYSSHSVFMQLLLSINPNTLHWMQVKRPRFFNHYLFTIRNLLNLVFRIRNADDILSMTPNDRDSTHVPMFLFMNKYLTFKF